VAAARLYELLKSRLQLTFLGEATDQIQAATTNDSDGEIKPFTAPPQQAPQPPWFVLDETPLTSSTTSWRLQCSSAAATHETTQLKLEDSYTKGCKVQMEVVAFGAASTV